MKVLITGATGMVGQGVLRECLLDPGVEKVITLGRRAAEAQSAKLEQVVHADLMNLTPVESRLSGIDACYFCLGVTSIGKSEDE